ncbi:hypothetical protein [Runella salmonicolor]|uniref:Uncharacterized protein n=1 Tax=Runella salmonicolor TaxID=2950278 RepID=A0ABT1FRR8_9BACT|nr:hypothetical protein [Runella salmonicolor]MCP1384459.1 hypothetical protein [Runella salmonicolor]
MQLNWKNLKEVVGNLVTSNKLSQEEAQRLQSAVDVDATATNEPPAAAPVAAATITAEAATNAGAAIAAVVAAAAPAPVAPAVVPPAAPVAAAPAPAAPTAAETSELERLRAENAALKASQNQTITAAGVPAGDVTNGNAAPKGEEVNPHFADLKRIKEKYGKFGLTAEIVLD